MSGPLKHEAQPPVRNSSPPHSKHKTNELSLNAEIVRLEAIACARSISNLWSLGEAEICTFFAKYRSLPGSSIQAPKLFTMEGARIIKTENKIYLGQISNKKRHGQGISIYRDGRIYEGRFSENEKSGLGCELYSNGNLYVGSFAQNKKHGQGCFYWFSLCAPACTKDSSYFVEQYDGQWWGGLPDGHGRHQRTNGDHYVGGFRNGLKHGQGLEHYANGDVYEGEFINGLSEGYGQYRWRDGSVYKGDFKQGYRNGYGVWNSEDGREEYKGHYLLDRKHGYGVYDWGNGTVYRGNYLEDSRNGYGQLFKDGQNMYSGPWENGQQAQGEQVFTPPKKKRQSSAEKDNSGSYSFRVKSSTKPSQSLTRKSSKSTTKRDDFQIDFKLVDNLAVTHRNCHACCRRPQTSDKIHISKFRRSSHRPNPELTH